jgi:hypothetical protein
MYRNLVLPNGEAATVYSNGMAEIFGKARTTVEYRMLPPVGAGQPGTAATLPGKSQLVWELSKAPASPYAAGELEVVLSPSVAAVAPDRVVPRSTLDRLRAATPRPGASAVGAVPDYTTSPTLNRVLGGLGVDSIAQVFKGATAATFATSAASADAGGSPSLDLARAYVLHVTDATMPVALTALLASPAIAYASPDWTVSALNTAATPIPVARRKAAEAISARLSNSGTPNLPALPTNFALRSSEQALLNAPSVSWTPAYETLEAKYHELPGTGETITDVSLGDLDSAGLAAADPCSGYVDAFGPTTIIRKGQRYLDWPSMPLIPTWTASAAATLDPVGEICGVDPFDTEIGLDFSMMAPLPHKLQRPGSAGSGLTDLLGIAPGAEFRLVVPSSSSGAITTVDEAFLAAAQQNPRPNVITASLAFGLDSEGFPSRYLEDDPITEALIFSLVHQFHITVSIAANDGLRTSTDAAVGPSGGSAATNVTPAGGQPTNLNDVQLSTVASEDYDSGAIDAGGTTLDDIFAAPPQDPAESSLRAQHAFAEVRWDGSADFSSGYGSRVDISAPGDDVVGFEHTFGEAATAVTPVNIGGTSASCQEIGAAAAVVQQVARLTGDASLASNPVALRAYLEKTATPVPNVSQADRTLHVGPQVNLAAAVDTLVAARTGFQLPAGVARVAIEQRQPDPGYFDDVYFTATSPASISLAGVDQDAWITISPDWVGLPTNATYRLVALGQRGGSRTLGGGPWARLLPATILKAAGLPPAPTSPEAVALRYSAYSGDARVASVVIPLAFTAVSGSPEALAPVVPPVTRGASFTVKYNFAGQAGFSAPTLVVSAAGRMDPFDFFYKPIYSVPLTATSGTVSVPVSALQGGGMYGVAIQASPTAFAFSDFAYTRVQGAASDLQPPAPLLSAPGSPPGHLLDIGYGGTFDVAWDVSMVPGATGATLEVSAPGPNDFNSYSTFNNPGGTIRDDNGRDSGSVYFVPLPGPSGDISLSGPAVGLDPTMYHNVRVLPTTSSGAAAGESSEVSTITMNGVTPLDGGSVVEGYGVSTHGSAGFVTSNQVNAAGLPQSSVETFNQATNAITGTVVSATDADQYFTLGGAGPGIFAGDVGLYADGTATSTTYPILHPVATGTQKGHWRPPHADLPGGPSPQIQPAPNQKTASTAFFSGSNGPRGRPQVFSSDVGAHTFGPATSIEAPVAGFVYPFFTGTAEDTATGTAVVTAADFGNPSLPPTFITVKLANGTVGSFAGVGSFDSSGLAVDSATDTAIGPESSGFGLYDLATGAGTLVSPGGFVYQQPTEDSNDNGFVVQEVSPPDANIITPGLGSTPNDNALSAELVVNSEGQVLQRIERFDFFNVSTFIAGAQTQLNSETGVGYTFGSLAQQLEPFRY